MDSSVFLNKLCLHGKVLGWIHTHVMGTPVGFSSVDCHTQFLFNKFMYPGIKGFVVEIPASIIDCFVLSDQGELQIDFCLNNYSYESQQFHNDCSSSNFYRSIMHDACLPHGLPFNVLDKRS